MTSDIELLANQDTYIDTLNDLPLISGHDNAQQSVALSTLDTTELFIGNRPTHKLYNKLKGDVRDALQQDPNVSSVNSVTITNIDEENDTVDIAISLVGDSSFSITLQSQYQSSQS